MSKCDYHPFGLGKVRITEATEGEVFTLDNSHVTGTLKECIIVPEAEGSFIAKVLRPAGFGSLEELVREWEQPDNSCTLRAKVSHLLFGKSPMGYLFYFREQWTLGNGAVSVIVGDATGMTHAREAGLVPKKFFTDEAMQTHFRELGYGSFA